MCIYACVSVCNVGLACLESCDLNCLLSLLLSFPISVIPRCMYFIFELRQSFRFINISLLLCVLRMQHPHLVGMDSRRRLEQGP